MSEGGGGTSDCILYRRNQSVVSVNGKVSGKREIGHTCNHLTAIA